MNRLYTGNEHFTFEGMPTNRLLSDFLLWVSSDLTNSVTRSILAEYIVSSALNLNITLRQTDEPYRIHYNGNVLETKSSAYIQSLHNDVLSSPVFGIAPTYAWNNGEIVKRERKSQIYVFCLLDCLNREKVEPLHLEQWKFYILPTSTLNEKCYDQKTLTLNALKALNPIDATYETLKSVIDNYAERN